MQISKILTNKKVLAIAVGLACATAIGFSGQAQAGGYYGGCSTCKVYKYRHHYRHYRSCNRCYYNNCNSCCYNTCNYCNYGCGYSCSGCGGGYYYGGYYY